MQALQSESVAVSPKLTTTIEALHNALRAVVPFASKDETRFHLCRVAFRFNANEYSGIPTLDMVATNGHVLAQATIEIRDAIVGEAGTIYCLQADELDRIRKSLKFRKSERDREVTVSFDATPKNTGTLRIDVAGRLGLTANLQVATDFPRWENVITERGSKDRKSNRSEVVGLSGKYLALIGTAAVHFEGPHCSRESGIEVTTGDALDPVRADVEATAIGRLTIVLMPMRL